MNSLRTRIVTLVLSAIALVLLPLVVLTYSFTMGEVDELFDARLAENAKTLDVMGTSIDAPAQDSQIVESAQPRAERHRLVVRGHEYENQIGFQIWNADNQLTISSENFKELVLDAAPGGYADVQIRNRRWRMFTYLAGDHRWIRVGERYDSRREIGRALAGEACLPLLIAFPLLAFLIRAAVARGLRPLRMLAEQLQLRPIDAVNPVGGGDIPRELYPVVRELNGLLGRLGKSLDDERAFTTNAAHELRTPLTGAVIHLENALAAPNWAASQPSLVDARIGLERMTRLVNQLLDLARWDAGQTQPMSAVDLRACVNEELADAGAALAKKNLEIIWRDTSEHARVLGWHAGLRTLMRNLLENAIRHSPPQGTIVLELSAQDAYVSFAITDQGPGIAPAERADVFKRFRRGAEVAPDSGAGIGLALVARIAEMHRATVALGNGEDDRGLRVEVRFPTASNTRA